MYTDGSVQDAITNGSSGVYIKSPDGKTEEISEPAGALCSNYRAEVQALTTATDYLLQKKKGNCPTVMNRFTLCTSVS